MKKLLLALLVLAVCAAPAFASVQSVQVGGTIRQELINRYNYNLGVHSVDGDEQQSVFVTHTLLNVSADLTDNVSAKVVLMNERAWDNDSSGTAVEISEAFIELREFLYSPLSAKIGRHFIGKGNNLIIGGGQHINSSGVVSVDNDNRMGIAFDAISLELDYNPLVISAFAAKVDAGNVNFQLDDNEADNNDDKDLFGIQAAYELGDDMDTSIEAYFIAEYDRSLIGNAHEVGGARSIEPQTIYIPGILVSTNPLEGLGLSVEVAHQTGATEVDSDGNANESQYAVNRNAWAVQVISDYAVPVP